MVIRKGIHRINYQCLRPWLVFLGKAVIKYRKKERFSLATANTCSNDGVFAFLYLSGSPFLMNEDGLEVWEYIGDSLIKYTLFDRFGERRSSLELAR